MSLWCVMPTNSSQNVVRTLANDKNWTWKQHKQIIDFKFYFDIIIIIVIIIIIIILIIIITQHKSHATCPNSEFVFRFYIYYTELSPIANGDILDWYFITQQGIRTLIIMITSHQGYMSVPLAWHGKICKGYGSVPLASEARGTDPYL